MKFLTVLLLLCISSIALAEKESLPLESFNANDENGELWSSKEHIGKKYLVVYFYPAAMTGGCTKQACSYRDDYQKFVDLGAEVVGVSADPVKNLKAFKKMHKLNFSLLSDVNGVIAARFGVPSRNGGAITREIAGLSQVFSRSMSLSRWTFILDKEGRIIYKNDKVKAANDSAGILKVLAGLK